LGIVYHIGFTNEAGRSMHSRLSLFLIGWC